MRYLPVLASVTADDWARALRMPYKQLVRRYRGPITPRMAVALGTRPQRLPAHPPHIVYDWYATPLEIEELRLKYAVSEAELLHILREHGTGFPLMLSDQDLIELDGTPLEEIAAKFGTSVHVVKQRRRKLGLAQQRRSRLDDHEWAEIFKNKTLTPREIALTYKVPLSTVYHKRNKLR